MTDTKEILKQVKTIEIKTKHLVDSLLAGNYHSVFKGQGIEFSELREYVPGDDIRAIDWKVTARFNHPFVREFIEERELQVYFLLDVSGSNQFGNMISKQRKALEMIASLMFSAIKNNDKVGLALFTNEIEHFIPARKGRKHILKLISKIINYKPNKRTTDLNKSLRYLSKIVKRRSIIFIVSDFYIQNFEEPLKLLKKRHDVIAILLSDQRELDIPDIGYIELEDEETGEQILVDTSDQEFRKNYQTIINNEKSKLLKTFNKLHIDSLQLVTNQPYGIPLKKFFKKRKMKVH